MSDFSGKYLREYRKPLSHSSLLFRPEAVAPNPVFQIGYTRRRLTHDKRRTAATKCSRANHRHTKSDGLLERNHLSGVAGDAINAILVAAGHNLRLLVAYLTALLRALLAAWLPAARHAMAAA